MTRSELRSTPLEVAVRDRGAHQVEQPARASTGVSYTQFYQLFNGGLIRLPQAAVRPTRVLMKAALTVLLEPVDPLTLMSLESFVSYVPERFSTWSCAVGCWVRGNVPLEPHRSVDQLGRDLLDLVGHRHFGRWRDANSLGCFTELGRLEELARPCRVLVFSKEDGDRRDCRSYGRP